MSTSIESDLQHLCVDCGRNVTYSFSEEEPAPVDPVCVLCMIQSFCKGDCGAHVDDVAMYDIRVMTRVWMVLEMVHGLADSLDVTSEMYDAGKRPLSGLERDLSEHHLGTAMIDVLHTASQEMLAAFRRLAASLADTRDKHPGETWFALNHHPAHQLIVEEWERTA